MTESLSQPSLYRAQHMAAETTKSTWFPCYNSEYVNSQLGLNGKFIWVYSKGFNCVAFAGHALSKTIEVVMYVAHPLLVGGKFLLGWTVTPLMNLVYPLNPISGSRHFIWVSRRVEKFLGDWVFFPLNTFDYREISQPRSETLRKVQTVFSRLQEANQKLLNPDGEKVVFDYRVKILKSPQINAFAVPGGGVAIFSQLAKKLDRVLQNQRITNIDVHFADGSKATVNVSGVTLEDTLAAVLGHELTHVASRHSMASLTLSCIMTALTAISHCALLAFLKGKDEEYQKLKGKASLSYSEQHSLRSKEAFYSTVSRIFSWAEDKVRILSSNLISRSHEYEADVTGVYFARQASFNPLGALLLQELFLRMDSPASDFLHRHFEVLFTHPYGENRKRAIFAAIKEFDPEALKGRVTWELAKNRYDLSRSSMAIKYATETSCTVA